MNASEQAVSTAAPRIIQVTAMSNQVCCAKHSVRRLDRTALMIE